jgi:hypothetical protein
MPPMAGNMGTPLVEPVVNPAVREARRRRLIRMTNEQVAGRRGPVRQIRYGTRSSRRSRWNLNAGSSCSAPSGLTVQAAEASQALRETLQQAPWRRRHWPSQSPGRARPGRCAPLAVLAAAVPLAVLAAALRPSSCGRFRRAERLPISSAWTKGINRTEKWS